MDVSIRQTNETDFDIIVHIGRIGVEESHRESCSVEDMNIFLDAHYNEAAIKEELRNEKHIYHIIYYKEQPVGFSKMVYNMEHPNLPQRPLTKLDRIYLLSEYYDLKLGRELLQQNIALSKQNGQAGMWLFTWQDNHRAVNFYKKAGFGIVGEHWFKVSETHYNHHHQMLLTY